MQTMYIDNWQTQLRKGLLDVVIMNLLSHGPCHGYEMVRQLKKIQGLQMREGNIYPILVRLEEESLIKSYTQSSTDGPPRKYFELTQAGMEILDQMNLHWKQMIESICHVRKGVFK
jgi:PadR family transcriptional regulator PadR